MIYVRLMGGLGNQMFQYALGRRLSLQHGTKLALDRSHFSEHRPGETIREYELDCFNVEAEMFVEPAEKLIQKKGLYLRPKPLNIYTESGPAFDPVALKQTGNTLFIGYWQNEKYFKKISPTIRSDFTFVKSLSKEKQSYAEQIQDTPGSVAIQIRRGDYVTNKNSNKFHGITPMEYYDKAIKKISRAVKKPVFFVISDDHLWCKQNLKIGLPTVIIEHIPGTGQEDMNLMSQCKHQIIANSSYGWWAAWLNKNPNKIIIAPKTWFRDKQANSKMEIVPPGWVRI